jgi:hypothetical protein
MTHLLKSRRVWVAAAAVVLTLVVAWHLSAFSSRLDPDVPYRIDLGRGSGWHGLETVKVRQDGTVLLHRQQVERKEEPKGVVIYLYWETTTLHLPEGALAKILDAVAANRLLGLRREYIDSEVQDGSQWVLWIQQGDREQVVYCSNRFPEELVQFAVTLDEILAENGLERAEWHRVAYSDHDGELWRCITP